MTTMTMSHVSMSTDLSECRVREELMSTPSSSQVPDSVPTSSPTRGPISGAKKLTSSTWPCWKRSCGLDAPVVLAEGPLLLCGRLWPPDPPGVALASALMSDEVAELAPSVGFEGVLLAALLTVGTTGQLAPTEASTTC